MRISDWSSDVCSSDLCGSLFPVFGHGKRRLDQRPVGARPVRALAEHLAERAPAALAVEQAEKVAGDVLEEDSPRQLAFHVRPQRATDRTRVVSGKSVSVRVDPGGRRTIKKKTQLNN